MFIPPTFIFLFFFKNKYITTIFHPVDAARFLIERKSSQPSGVFGSKEKTKRDTAEDTTPSESENVVPFSLSC